MVLGGTIVGAVAWYGAAVSAVIDHPAGTTRWIPVAIALGLAGAITTVVGGRAARSAVRTDADGITVVNPFRTYRFSWSEIAGFELGQSGRRPCIGIVVLRDGRQVPVLGIRAAHGFLRSAPEPAERVIRQLDDERARHKSTVVD